MRNWHEKNWIAEKFLFLVPKKKKQNPVSAEVRVFLHPRNCKINHSDELYRYKVKAWHEKVVVLV